MKNILSAILILLCGVVFVNAENYSYNEWYTLNSKGRDIGYTHITIERSIYEGEKSWEITKESYLRFRFLFKKFEMKTQEKIYLDNEGGLLHFSRTVSEDGNLKRTVGFRKNHILNIECDHNGVKKLIRVNTKDYDYSTYGLEFLILTQGESIPQEVKEIKVLDPETLSILIGTLENKGKKMIEYNGEMKELKIIERWLGKVLVTLYLTDDGKKLKEFAKDYQIKLSTKDKILRKYK